MQGHPVIITKKEGERAKEDVVVLTESILVFMVWGHVCSLDGVSCLYAAVYSTVPQLAGAVYIQYVIQYDFRRNTQEILEG